MTPKEANLDRPNIIGIEAEVERGDAGMDEVLFFSDADKWTIGTAPDGEHAILVRVKGRTVGFTTESLLAAAEDALANADER